MSQLKKPEWLNDARISIAWLTGNQEEIINAHIHAAGGLTTDELEMWTGYRHSSICIRLTSLRKKGEVITTKEQRLARSGRKAFINRPIKK